MSAPSPSSSRILSSIKVSDLLQKPNLSSLSAKLSYRKRISLNQSSASIMAAAVCGTKRAYFFEDEICSSIPLLKRIRSTSPASIRPQPAPKENPVPNNPVPANGEQWVGLLVKEMMSATSLDDAKSRAGRVLEMLQKTISDRVAEEMVKSFETENYAIKERVEALSEENGVLKRAVVIQHEKLKEGKEKEKELEQCKEMVGKYEEKVRMLEVNNYALSVHLNRALQGHSLGGGRCNPDVY